MTTPLPTRLLRPTPVRAATLALTLTLALGLEGCSSLGDLFGGKSDYQSGSQRTRPLEVPPDLSQLQRDSRYLPQGGVVAASDLGKPGAPVSAATAAPAVAVDSMGDLHVERVGTQRVLVSARSPDVLWPSVRQFWIDRGFKLLEDNAVTGFIETDWAENKARLPRSWIRDTIGRYLDGLFDSGLRDRYRTRLERTPNGTEITITHFGIQEEITGWQKDSTQWVPRPNDPGLEAEMMQLMMVSLGAGDAAARSAVAGSPAATASATTGPTRARLVTGQPGATVQVDDGFDRAWRRVGLALDHGGFTVEDRDRAQGLYYVRFVDAKEAAKDEPNVFTRTWDWLFSSNEKSPVGKYRIQVKGEGNQSTVTILNNQGQPDNSENAQRIVTMLVGELK